jgi:hypothetical protein
MKFGQFDGICNQNALTVCPLLGEIGGVGLQPACYARNLEVTNTGVLIFQPGKLMSINNSIESIFLSINTSSPLLFYYHCYYYNSSYDDDDDDDNIALFI